METNKLQCLFKSWGHSREEDDDGVTVYRPRGYAFPLSRGRDGIEFYPNGTVRYLGPGPDDRSRAVNGLWTSAGGNMLEVRKATETAPRRVTVLECDDSVLKVRWE